MVLSVMLRTEDHVQVASITGERLLQGGWESALVRADFLPKLERTDTIESFDCT